MNKKELEEHIKKYYKTWYYVSVEFYNLKTISDEKWWEIDDIATEHYFKGGGDPRFGLMKNPIAHLGDFAFTFYELNNAKGFLEDILKLNYVKGAFFGKIKF